MRYAVYVEGLSELLFVADVLQKYSNYNSEQCGFLCVNLNAEQYDRMNNPIQGDIHSVNYYQIVNVKCWKCGFSVVEVINIGIVVEAQVGLIASLLEKVYNPFLLFWCKHPLAAVVAIVSAVPAQIVFNGIAKAGFVFRLHVLENGVEAPGHVLRLVCLEEAASLFVPVHRRIDGKSTVGFFWLVLSGHIAQAFASSRTVVEKA